MKQKIHENAELVTVQIHRSQWEELQKAAALLDKIGAPGNDPGHLLREFALGPLDCESIIEDYLQAVDMPDAELAKLRTRYHEQVKA